MKSSLRWLGPVLVLAVAAAARFWALGRPDTLVFDELFYVRDAISQLTHGYPTAWENSDAAIAGSASKAFTDVASNAVHPPLGKWLIGLGVLIFGPETGWGWRSAVALAGVGAVAVTMRLGWRISGSIGVATLAGLLLAIDGVHVVLSRVALLDGFLTYFVVLGALCIWRDQESMYGRELPAVQGESRRIPIVWRRPWLLAAGAVFGAAAATKWSGLYALAFFLVFVTVRDLAVRIRANQLRIKSVLRSALQALVTAGVALPAAAVVYVASWTGWVLNAGGWRREPGEAWPVSLAAYHADMLQWHSTLTAQHPFQSDPLSWVFGLFPTAMYRSDVDCVGGGQCVSMVSPLPNLLILWGGVAALIMLVVVVIVWATSARARLESNAFVLAAAFIVTGYLSGWLPWVLTFSRSAVFQFYTVVLTPFSALALALVLGVLCSSRPTPAGFRLNRSAEELQGRRIAVGIFLVAAGIVSIYFFPLWTGDPVPEWFWRAHLWLPHWV